MVLFEPPLPPNVAPAAGTQPVVPRFSEPKLKVQVDDVTVKVSFPAPPSETATVTWLLPVIDWLPVAGQAEHMDVEFIALLKTTVTVSPAARSPLALPSVTLVTVGPFVSTVK